MKKVVLSVTLLFFLFCPFSVFAAESKLIEGGASPNLVPPETPVTFFTIYEDPQGKPPVYVKLVMRDKSFDMKKVDGNFITGARYEYQWIPKEGDQGSEFHYEASDGKDTFRFPLYESGTLAPPNVISQKLNKNKIYLFSKDSDKPLISFDAKTNSVLNMAISADGSYWVAKAGDTIFFFSGTNREPAWQYQCSNNQEYGGWVAISGDGKYIAGGCNNALHLFTKDSNKPVWSYQSVQGEYTSIYTVSISKNGEFLALGTTTSNNGGLLAVFSKASNKPLWVHRFNPGNVHALAMSSDGNYIAVGTHCPDRKIYLFSRQSNQPLFEYVASEGSPVWSAAISADGQSAVYGLDSAGTYEGILLFNPNQKTPAKKWQTDWWIRSLGISSDGKYIAAGSGDHRIYLIDKDKGQPVWEFEAGDRVGTVGISSNGQYLVGGSKDKKIYFFAKESSKPLWEFQTDSWVNAVAISADGNFIVAGNGFAHYLAEGQHEVFNNPNKPFTDRIESSVTSQKQTEQDIGLPKSDKKASRRKVPGMLFGVGFLLSLLTLSFYLAILNFPFLKIIKESGAKLNHARFLSLLHLNTKKVAIILSVTTGIFLVLTLASLIFNKPTTVVTKPKEDGSNQPTLNQGEQNLPSNKQEGGICGNNMCEPDLGETKESCPKDCSAGN